MMMIIKTCFRNKLKKICNISKNMKKTISKAELILYNYNLFIMIGFQVSDSIDDLLLLLNRKDK